MSSYNVVFSGKLLGGFDPREVRLHAAERLRMSEAQLDRVFDGRPIVLKKGVDSLAGQRYLSELHRLGMASRLVEIEQAGAAKNELAAESSATFKVQFLGQLAPGFDKAAVALAAGRRLNLGPEQVTRLFSGKKVTLKRGVSKRLGQRYIDELASIGMLASMAEESLAAESEPTSISHQIAAPNVVLEPTVAPALVARVALPPTLPPTLPPIVTRADEVAGAVPDLETDEATSTPRLSGEPSPDGLISTQYEVPLAMMMTGDVPEPMEEHADHAATLLVDPMRLAEQMANYPVLSPAKPVDTGEAAATAIDTESAVAYVRCEQCGHRQPQASRCRRCGTELSFDQDLIAASAVKVVMAPPLVPTASTPSSSTPSLVADPTVAAFTALADEPAPAPAKAAKTPARFGKVPARPARTPAPPTILVPERNARDRAGSKIRWIIFFALVASSWALIFFLLR